MAKSKVGDTFEIKTPEGYAYIQVTHIHDRPPKMGALIRVLGDFEDKITDLSDLISVKSKFRAFFPVDQSLKLGTLSFVGNFPVPDFESDFPVFRNGVRNRDTKEIDVWWLWDGEKEWRAGALTDEILKLPIREVVNDTLLIERITSGWTTADYR